ncbi:MAG: TRADD-N-associated membrane domain-containing protein [Nostoc sp.]
MSNNKRQESKVKKSNWQSLPSDQENEEELRGDHLERRSRSRRKKGGIVRYMKNIFQNAQWELAKNLTLNQTTHLKLKEGIRPSIEDDEGRKKYQDILFQKAKLGFYGSLFAGTLGVTMNVVGFGMICFGQTQLGIPTAIGGFSLEGSALFMQKISKDANDRLDSYFGNGRDKDEDTEESKR